MPSPRVSSVPRLSAFSRRRGKIIALALLLWALPIPVWAVVIIEKGKDEAIYGYLVDANEVRVIVAIPTPGGETRERILPRASIEHITFAVSEDRLAELQPSNPRDYRDYADDLFEARKDPDARRTALRLYLIAAYLDPQDLGRGCLLAMSDLATRELQRRKYRAMVYLLDASHDRSVLTTTGMGSPSTVDLEQSQREVLQRGLRVFRNGRKKEGTNFAGRSDFRQALAKFPGHLTLDQYVAETESSKPELPAGMLRNVVALELELAGGRPVASTVPPDSGNWARVRLAASEPVTELSLVALTEFDPRQCVYRDGKWVAPNNVE